MYPTLESGDHLILEKVSYAFGEPDRFDIIVFRIPGDERTYYIKRVIALPGETVQIAEGVIYIDGIPLEENYGYEEMAYAGLCANPLTLRLPKEIAAEPLTRARIQTTRRSAD